MFLDYYIALLFVYVSTGNWAVYGAPEPIQHCLLVALWAKMAAPYNEGFVCVGTNLAFVEKRCPSLAWVAHFVVVCSSRFTSLSALLLSVLVVTFQTSGLTATCSGAMLIAEQAEKAHTLSVHNLRAKLATCDVA